MINFNKIEIENFGSYEHQIVDFKSGKHLVSGINGSGKSSVFEAIGYCIYKHMHRGKNPSRNHNGQCSVKLSFAVKENEYRVERYFKHKQYKNSLKLICNEEDISADTIRNTENLILELGFPSQELFIMTITIIQGLPINFSQLTNTRRKEILETLFSFNIWEDFRKKVKKFNKFTQTKQGEIHLNFTNKKEAMIALNSKLDTIKNMNTDRVTEIDSNVVKIKTNIKYNMSQINLLEQELSSNTGLFEEVSNLQQNLTKLNMRLSQNKSLVDNQSCPTCSRPYPAEDIDKAKAMIEKVKNKIQITKKQYDELKEINDNDTTLNNSIRDLQYDINNHKRSLKQSADEKTKLQKTIDIDKLQSELDELVEEVNRHKIDLDNILSELEHCNYVDSLLLPSSTFRTNILVKYIQYINQIIEEVGEYVFRGLKINLKVDDKCNGIDIALKKDNLESYEYGMLSGGEKKRLDIIIILALQRFLLESSGIATNLIVFDEIFDALDSEGVESILECLDYMYSESTCVYVISHNTSIKGMFDSILTVEKTEKVSKIV